MKAASPPHTDGSIVFARCRQCAPHLIGGSWGQPYSPQSNQHLDGFSRLCRAYDRDRQIDRQTDHATTSVTVGRIYVPTYVDAAYCDAAM